MRTVDEAMPKRRKIPPRTEALATSYNLLKIILPIFVLGVYRLLRAHGNLFYSFFIVLSCGTTTFGIYLCIMISLAGVLARVGNNSGSIERASLTILLNPCRVILGRAQYFVYDAHVIARKLILKSHFYFMISYKTIYSSYNYFNHVPSFCFFFNKFSTNLRSFIVLIVSQSPFIGKALKSFCFTSNGNVVFSINPFKGR